MGRIYSVFNYFFSSHIFCNRISGVAVHGVVSSVVLAGHCLFALPVNVDLAVV